jgi:hypothetical protein
MAKSDGENPGPTRHDIFPLTPTIVVSRGAQTPRDPEGLVALPYWGMSEPTQLVDPKTGFRLRCQLWRVDFPMLRHKFVESGILYGLEGNILLAGTWLCAMCQRKSKPSPDCSRAVSAARSLLPRLRKLRRKIREIDLANQGGRLIGGRHMFPFRDFIQGVDMIEKSVSVMESWVPRRLSEEGERASKKCMDAFFGQKAVAYALYRVFTRSAGLKSVEAFQRIGKFERDCQRVKRTPPNDDWVDRVHWQVNTLHPHVKATMDRILVGLIRGKWLMSPDGRWPWPMAGFREEAENL